MEGQAIEERFELPAAASLKVDGFLFSVDVSGYDGTTIAGRAVLSSRARSRNEIRIVTSATEDEVVIDVQHNDRDVLPSSMRWYPHLTLRVPNGVRLQVTAAGDIIVQDLRAPFTDLFTLEGDIIVRGVDTHLITRNGAGTTRVFSSAGEKRLLSSGGDVHVTSSHGNMRVQSVGGRVLLFGVRGDLVTNVRADELALTEHDGTVSFAEAPVTGGQTSAP